MIRGLLVLALFAASARGRTVVAFVEMRRPDGSRLELEPGDRYAHVAIAYRGRWLEARPWVGVQLASEVELRTHGKLGARLVDDAGVEPASDFVRRWLGRPYDDRFDWSEDARLYCTELVGKLLHVDPVPMRFEGEDWPEEIRARRGQPGLSPDELYRALKARGFREETVTSE